MTGVPGVPLYVFSYEVQAAKSQEILIVDCRFICIRKLCVATEILLKSNKTSLEDLNF